MTQRLEIWYMGSLYSHEMIPEISYQYSENNSGFVTKTEIATKIVMLRFWIISIIKLKSMISVCSLSGELAQIKTLKV